MTHRILQPPDWAAPRGYVNGIAARGTLVSVAGQVGWNASCEFESDDFVAQVRQALSNVREVLAQADAGPEHIVRMNWYLVDREEYVSAGKPLAAAWREFMTDADGRVHFPAMTAVQVAALIESRAKVEIEVTAVVPERL